MAYIGKKPSDIFRGNASYNSFTGDGSTTTFDVTNVMPDGGAFDVEVFVDNVRQEAGASKSYTIGQDGSGDLKRITFVSAPDDGSEIYVINPGKETALNTVGDNTITTAKIQADAVTAAKLPDDVINSEHITDGSVDNVHLAGSIANAKLANSAITINGTSIALGASGTIVAATDWQAVTVADGSTTLTAEAGKGYFLDTNTGVIEVFFPTSPSRGDTIVIVDYAGTFATNQAIINTGTNNLDSTTTRQYKLTTNDTTAEFIYVDAAKGWVTRILQAAGTTPTGVFTSGVYDTDAAYIAATGGTVTTSGNFKIHSFTGDGNFVVSSLGNTAGGGDYSNKVDYVVVAGGGGGGGGGCGGDGGAGAGAGGFREGRASSPAYTASPLVAPSGLTVTATTFPITVGGGGSAGSGPGNGTKGSNSVFSTITSTGGGLGQGNTPNSAAGGPGGSGGGGRGGGGPGYTAGNGNTPPVSPAQGQNGGVGGSGTGSNPQSPDNAAGGGGGATQAGDNAGPGDDAGVGGTGATTHITGSPVVYAGGGGGSGFPGGAGGSGGGGAGINLPSTDAGDAGSANTGGGGGGGRNGGAGGKGVVILRYKYQN